MILTPREELNFDINVRERAKQKDPPGQGGPSRVAGRNGVRLVEPPYLGGAGVNPSRRWPGSGLGLGLGAFLTSFLPLSLLPMYRSVPQKGCSGKGTGAEVRNG